MAPQIGQAEVTSRDVKKNFTYRGVTMVEFDASYPQITLRGNSWAQTRINLYYLHQYQQFYRTAGGPLLRDAIKEYHDSLTGQFPFRPFNATMRFTVTLNANCHLSIYYDQYQYTGGAHGNTLRYADTWNLQTGTRVTMGDLFRTGQPWRRLVLAQAIQIAEFNMAQNPGIYFDDYKKLMEQNFDPKNYFLTPKGVSVYYQQYAIAPYSSGIVVFNIPYEKLGIQRPRCMD